MKTKPEVEASVFSFCPLPSSLLLRRLLESPQVVHEGGARGGGGGKGRGDLKGNFGKSPPHCDI